MSGSVTYLNECPDDTCRVLFIGAPPAEVLDHIWTAHGDTEAHLYLDTHSAFEDLPDDYLADRNHNE